MAGPIAPLIVSRTTGGAGAHARTGHSAPSASKTLCQRKIIPDRLVFPRDERRSKCSRSYGQSAHRAWAQKASSAGKGKELVDAHCNSCHALTARTGSGYDAKGWRTVMRMMTNQGVALAKNEIAPMTAYLTKAFPEKGQPAAKVVKGPLKVSMKIWKAPTPGSRPPDPLSALRASLRCTGQSA